MAWKCGVRAVQSTGNQPMMVRHCVYRHKAECSSSTGSTLTLTPSPRTRVRSPAVSRGGHAHLTTHDLSPATGAMDCAVSVQHVSNAKGDLTLKVPGHTHTPRTVYKHVLACAIARAVSWGVPCRKVLQAAPARRACLHTHLNREHWSLSLNRAHKLLAAHVERPEQQAVQNRLGGQGGA